MLRYSWPFSETSALTEPHSEIILVTKRCVEIPAALIAAIAIGGCGGSAGRPSDVVPTAELGMDVQVQQLSDVYRLTVSLRDSQAGGGLLPVDGGRTIGLAENDELVVVTSQRTIMSSASNGTTFDIGFDELPGTVRIELRRSEEQEDALNTTFSLQRAARVLTPASGSEISSDGVLDISWGVVDGGENVVDAIAVRRVSVIPECLAPEELFQLVGAPDASSPGLASPIAVNLRDVLPPSATSAESPCEATLRMDFEDFDYGAAVSYDERLAPRPSDAQTSGRAVYYNDAGLVRIVLR